MSFFTRIFESDPWREAEREIKRRKWSAINGFKDMIARLAPEILLSLYNIILHELAKRRLPAPQPNKDNGEGEE